MRGRVHLLNKDCLPPNDERPDDFGQSPLQRTRPIPFWLLVLGGVALVAYVVFASFMR
ncbi:MAG: hypothetical protein ACKVXR_01940 [Planctomycetota bacterium]